MKIITFLILIILLNGCTTPEEPKKVEEMKIEHKYYSVGQNVDSFSYDYIINSLSSVEGLKAKEGNRWLLMDVTIINNDPEETTMYGEAPYLMDNEKYYYRGYTREEPIQGNGRRRDSILFEIPASKKDFQFFFDFYDLNKVDIDEESRRIVRIEVNS